LHGLFIRNPDKGVNNLLAPPRAVMTFYGKGTFAFREGGPYSGVMKWIRFGVALLVCVAGTSRLLAEEVPLEWFPLDAFAGAFGVDSVVETVNVTNSTVVWETPGATLRFFDGSRRLEFNGTLVWLNGAISTNAMAERMISETDLESVLAPLLLATVPSNAPWGTFVVVLDPGHGGVDPGAVVSTNVPYEKDLVLDVAKRVRRILRQSGIVVRMTRRDDDKTLTLEDRTTIARKREGSVLVSIHANKAASRSAQGIETFVLPAAGFPSTASSEPVAEVYPGNLYDAESLQLGYFIHRELLDQVQAVDRGVKRARYEVLRNAPCPAALVELGFMSHAAELNKLNTEDYRQRLAEGIAQGVRIFMLQNTSPGGD